MFKAFCCCVASMAFGAGPSWAESFDDVHYVESDLATGSSAAVIVPQRRLLFTAQWLPANDQGEIASDAAVQAEAALGKVLDDLQAQSGAPATLVKLNVYMTEDAHAEVVSRVLSARFTSEARPAVSFVTTALPHPRVLVAMDGVGVAGRKAEDADENARGGAWLYISGQAEPGELLEATRKTLASLGATLEQHGLSARNAVELKCFLQPMSRAQEVRQVIDDYFAGRPPLPVSFVEWKSNLPIEIELIAAAGPARDAGEAVEYLPALKLDSSPLFSRAVRVNGGPQIFFSSIDGPAGGSAADELEGSFRRLSKLLEKTGSDLTHLVKATYYVRDDAANKAHNEVRAHYYQPARPPAASKALVAGAGRTGLRYTMDMIAVPSSRGTPPSDSEYGHGLAADEALAGWISLFDGHSDFGWRQAHAGNGRLQGGVSQARFGPCDVRAEFDGPGLLKMGDREVRSDGGNVELAYDGPRAALKLGPDSKAVSIVLRPRGLEPLFNGRNLDGWKRIDRASLAEAARPLWHVEHGVLRVVSGPGALECTARQYGNLVLQLVVRSRAVHSNGGLFFRAIEGDFMNGYEAQLHNRAVDDDPSQPYRYATGGIDDRQNARRLASRDFAPFRMTVLADGPHIATWVNGVQTTDWTDDRSPHENPREGLRLHAGVVQLQAHDPLTDYELHEIAAAELP